MEPRRENSTVREKTLKECDGSAQLFSSVANTNTRIQTDTQ